MASCGRCEAWRRRTWRRCSAIQAQLERRARRTIGRSRARRRRGSAACASTSTPRDDGLCRRDPHPRARRPAAGGSPSAGRGAVADRPAARPRHRLRPDRAPARARRWRRWCRQALRAAAAGADHARGSDRVSHPGGIRRRAGAPARGRTRRARLRHRAARRAARGPRRPPDRRDARRRDDRPGADRRRDRPPRARQPAQPHQRLGRSSASSTPIRRSASGRSACSSPTRCAP